jgi:hypothetical protein
LYSARNTVSLPVLKPSIKSASLNRTLLDIKCLY